MNAVTVSIVSEMTATDQAERSGVTTESVCAALPLSVVITSWNAREYLVQCLRTLEPEVARNHGEIIVVDNCSSDGSGDAVKEHFEGVQLVRNSVNLGFAKANNIGIERCRGRYLFLINSDVTVSAGCIERLIDYMDEHPRIGILGPKVLNADGTLQHSCWGFPTPWNSFCRALALDTAFPKSKMFSAQLMTYWSFDRVRAVDAISGCFWVVRAEALRQVGLLDEQFFMYSEDKDWCKRFWKAGWEVVYFPDVSIVHYGGGSSASEPVRFAVEMQKANMLYWRKHHSRKGQYIFWAIGTLHQAIRLVAASLLYLFNAAQRKELSSKMSASMGCLTVLLRPDRA